MAFHFSLRKFFLYAVAGIGLVLCVISLVQIIDLGLRTYVFTKADYPCYFDKMMMAPMENSGMSQAQLDEQARVNERHCIEQRASDKQRQAATAIAMVIVGAPLYLYHWRILRQDKE